MADDQTAAPQTTTAPPATIPAPAQTTISATPYDPNTDPNSVEYRGAANVVSRVSSRIWDAIKEGIPAFNDKFEAASHTETGKLATGEIPKEQLITPEAAMTPAERKSHPILTGVAETAGSFTSPEQIALMAGTGGFGELPGTAGKLIPKLVSLGFSAGALKGAYDQIPAFKAAMDKGDASEAERIISHIVLDTAVGEAAGEHGLSDLGTGLEKTDTGRTFTKGAEIDFSKVGGTKLDRRAPDSPFRTPGTTMKKVADQSYAAMREHGIDTTPAPVETKLEEPSGKFAPVGGVEQRAATTFGRTGGSFGRTVDQTYDVLRAPEAAGDKTPVEVSNQVESKKETPEKNKLTYDNFPHDEVNKLAEQWFVKNIRNHDPEMGEAAVTFYRDAKGKIKHTQVNLGNVAEVEFPENPPGTEYLGSLHTHGEEGGEGLSDYDSEEGQKHANKTNSPHYQFVASMGDNGWQLDNEFFEPEPDAGVPGKMSVNTGVHPDLQKLSDKYGVSEDAEKVRNGASFIRPDGRFIHLGGTEHNRAIENITGKVDATQDNRPDFLASTGAVRTRFHLGRGDETLSVSVPEKGVTEEQVSALKDAFRSSMDHGRGNLVMEVGTPDGKSTQSDYVTANEIEPALARIGAMPNQRVNLSDAYGDTGHYIGGHVPSYADQVRARSRDANWDAQAKGAPEGVTNRQRYTENLGVTHGPELLETPKDRLGESGTPETLMHHEVAHVVAAHLLGLPVEGVEIRSHLHPELKDTGAAGAAYFDFSKLPGATMGADGKKATLPISALVDALPKLLHLYMAGGAGEQLIDGTSMLTNAGMGGDLNAAEKVARAAGLSRPEANYRIRKAMMDTKNMLDTPEILDIIKNASATREEGLSKTLHMSKERVQRDIIQKLNEVTSGKRTDNIDTSTGDTAGTVRGADQGIGEAASSREGQVSGGAAKGNESTAVQGSLFSDASPKMKKVVEDTPWTDEETGNRKLMITESGNHVGQLQYSGDPDSGVARIRVSGIKPEYRNQGIAKEMYKSAIEDAKRKGFKFLTSDQTVSRDARRVWDSLALDGKYPIETIHKKGFNPNGGGITYRVDLRKAEPWAQSAASVAKANGGGFTIHPETGEVPKTGYQVEAVPEARRILDHTATPQDIQQFHADNKDIFDKNPELHVGGYENELNVSAKAEDRDSAMALARKLDQKSIWDNAKGEEVPTGGANKQTKFPDYPLEQRLADLKTKTTPENVGAAVSNFTKSDESYKILDSTGGKGGTWTQGGCWILADAIQKQFGGDLVSITTPEGRVQHVGVQIGSKIIDADGATSPEKWRDFWEKTEQVKNAKIQPFDPNKVPDSIPAPEKGKEIANGVLGHLDKVQARTAPLPEDYQSKVDAIRKTHGDDAAFNEVSQYLKPEEREEVGKVLKRNVLDQFAKLPPMEEFEEAAKAGEIQKGWYKNTATVLKDVFGQDTGTFTDIVAALSPLKAVRENFRDALEFYADWVDAGRPTSGKKLNAITTNKFMGTYAQNLQRAVRGEDVSGAKVSNFAENLKGNLNEITKDRWMSFFKGNPKGWSSHQVSSDKLAFDVAMRRTAEKLGWDPAEVQETIWSFVKSVVESSEKEGVSPSEKAGNITDTEVREGAGSFANLIKDPKIAASFERVADATGDNRFRPESVQSSKGYRKSQRSTPAPTGKSVGGSADVLGRVAERTAAAARVGTIQKGIAKLGEERQPGDE